MTASRSGARRRLAGAGVSLALFAGAVMVLRAQLHDHPVHEITAELRSFSPVRLVLSLVATGLGFLALAGYDAVSLSALGRRLPFRRIAYASFLGYAFANSLPLSVVTGAAVRYRLYQQWGIARGDAARVITLNTITYVVGLLAAAGVAFAIQPVLVPGFLRIPLHTVRPLGGFCLLLVAGYLVWSRRQAGDLRIWRWSVPHPTFSSAVGQIGVSVADWLFSGAALFVLLPSRVPFHVFFAVFLLGQIAGLVAQVPAGLGVFEAVMLWGLTPALSTASVLVALVGYRLVYFFLPLAIATGIWVWREGRRWHRRRLAERRPVAS